MAAPGSKLSYTPQPHEQAYYEGLFAAADTQRTGSIGGAQAVQFFSRSKLPVEALKTVWTVADQPPTNALDKNKFFVAVRLIELLQNGQKGEGTNLATPPGVVLRPVTFEGVSGVSVPMPPPAPAPGQRGPTPTPPVQQQRGPTPTPPIQQQQQQQQQPPRSPRPMQQQVPPRSPQGSQGQAPYRPPQSTALTAQDPYTLTPSEQSRYEAIFPEYARPDGYVYGKEAVDLFSKSGAPQQALAAIWNMVDLPVDNRLDKLEFAMAMHLIVCISKKNLPMPPGLPISLKQLKSQQQQQQQQQRMSPVHHQQQQQRMSPVHQSVQPPPSPQMSSLPPPAMQPAPVMAQAAPPLVPSIGQQQQQQQPTQVQQQQGPPPVQPTFTNESAAGAAGGFSSLQGPPPLENKAGGSLSISDAFEGLSAADAGARYMANNPIQPESVASFETAPSAASPPGSPVPRAAPAPPPVAPVEPVKTAQQLKESYNMGEASDELVKLKAVLQKLQAENISLKATMGSLTEEEKDVQKELSAVVKEIGDLSSKLTTLRAQVLAAKSRLLESTAELKAAQEKKGVITDLIAEASATKEAIDEACQDIHNAAEATQAPPAPAPATFEADLFGFGNPTPAQAPEPAPVPEPAPLPEPAEAQPHVSKVNAPSFESGASATAPSFESGASATKTQDMEAAPAYQYNAPAPAVTNSAPAGHNRIASNESVGYNEGEGIMGGKPIPLPSETPAFTYGEAPPSMQDVEDLKKKLKEAEDVAQAAEESRRQVVAQADELRRVADEADAKARQHANQSEGKKKGLLGRGKRKDMKEGDRLDLDAKKKKEKLLAMQSQVNDAQALVIETRREADRLRREAEEAEVKAASHASMHHTQPPTNGYPSAPNPGPSYGMGHSMGPSSYGMGQTPPAPVPASSNIDEGHDKEALGGHDTVGFNSNVMGSGGISIPMPASGSDDPYSNPFE